MVCNLQITEGRRRFSQAWCNIIGLTEAWAEQNGNKFRLSTPFELNELQRMKGEEKGETQSVGKGKGDVSGWCYEM